MENTEKRQLRRQLWRQTRRQMIPVAAGIVAGVMCAVIGPSACLGKIPYGDLALYGAYLCAGPIAVVSLLLLAVPFARRKRLPGIGLGISLFLLICLAGQPRADQLKRVHNRAAREYCYELIFKLDNYKLEHGEYPENIKDMLPSDRSSLSIYLRDGDFYHKGTNSFNFGWFDSPGFPLCSGGTSYHHDTKHWDACADWGSWTGGVEPYDDSPDTEANRAGFRRHLEMPATTNFTEVFYYASESGFQRQLSFKCGQTEIDEIVSRHGLQPMSDIRNRISPRDDFSWWMPNATDNCQLWGREPQTGFFSYLWYSKEEEKAYYLEW